MTQQELARTLRVSKFIVSSFNEEGRRRIRAAEVRVRRQAACMGLKATLSRGENRSWTIRDAQLRMDLVRGVQTDDALKILREIREVLSDDD